jgi:2-succinyl-5-enolpyruvyl-6-hydroxy-3-cyclohexene-1-carboxylate synthase
MSISTFNRRWSAVILESLRRHGIQHICIAPGSRSTPLTLEAASNNGFVCHTHFDERGLGYMALAMAKASGRPVAVIVTSGTAVANLYPALIEASLTGEKLVLLTADRPPELIDCGANQAIRQQGIFADHATVAINLPRPTPDISAGWLASTIDDAMLRLHQGVLHINCPFAEPLYGNDDGEFAEWSLKLGTWWKDNLPWVRSDNTFTTMKQSDWPLWRQKRGLVVAGRLSAEEGALVARWADALGWPLIGDVLSSTGQPMPGADLWLNHPTAKRLLEKVDIVIHFGANPTGKRALELLSSVQSETYWTINSLEQRVDANNHRGRRLVANISTWLGLHQATVKNEWAAELFSLSEKIYGHVHGHLAGGFSESLVAANLCQLLPAHGQLFLGNSLIVRLIDAFAQLPVGYPVFSNRGASGIDGLIASAVGVQKANQKSTLAVIGDISALYDLNSLALLAQNSVPMVLIVVNNNGGSIFSLLPTPEAERERFYRMPHGFTFEHAAKMFNLKYAAPTDWQQMKTEINSHWASKGTLLVEVNVAPHEGAETLRYLVNSAANL